MKKNRFVQKIRHVLQTLIAIQICEKNLLFEILSPNWVGNFQFWAP